MWSILAENQVVYFNTSVLCVCIYKITKIRRYAVCVFIVRFDAFSSYTERVSKGSRVITSCVCLLHIVCHFIILDI